jgi:hypothetical protein
MGSSVPRDHGDLSTMYPCDLWNESCERWGALRDRDVTAKVKRSPGTVPESRQHTILLVSSRPSGFQISACNRDVR